MTLLVLFIENLGRSRQIVKFPADSRYSRKLDTDTFDTEACIKALLLIRFFRSLVGFSYSYPEQI
jgi:hypothetical protein